MRDYTKIEAWQLADEFAVAVYEETRRFPREELYGLSNQIRRAVISVAANIVEGSARETQKDYLHFLYIARGSLAEAQYLLHLGQRLGYLIDPNAGDLAAKGRRTFACLHGLIQAVERNTGKAP